MVVTRPADQTVASSRAPSPPCCGCARGPVRTAASIIVHDRRGDAARCSPQSLVPLVIGAVVDGPIRHHDTAGLWALAGVALLFGIAEAVLFFARRKAMASAALGIETDLRRDLFAHLQRLPVAFHDRWPSGPAAVAG